MISAEHLIKQEQTIPMASATENSNPAGTSNNYTGDTSQDQVQQQELAGKLLY